MISKIKSLFTNKGFIITLVLSLFCLFYFYGKLLQHPNQVYFGANGDGLQAYYGAMYHVKHDDSMWRMNGMNYPYGEQVFFTGCQPLVTNAIKIISYAIDISDYTVGIINLIMLLSIVLSALCIYLIFKHFKLPYLYSGIAAIAIAFLSPQMDRMAGHYSLSYHFAIPLFLLLLLKFYTSPSIKKSISIGLLTFFLAGTHFYFFGFFIVIFFCYWLDFFFLNKENFWKIKFAGKHLFIQLILPFLLIQLIIFCTDSVHDRTSFPWGYLEYVSNLTGVFYPTKRFYTPVFESFVKPEFPQWEGFSFVGIVAAVGFAGIVLTMLKHLLTINYKYIFIVTDNRMLNAFFWAGIISLLLAFGYPFKIKDLEWMLNSSGPLKQLRGIGRFTWTFYYVINIIAFYKIYWGAQNKKTIVKYGCYGLVLFFVCYDAYAMSFERQEWLNNPIAELNDTQNKLPENRWFNEINVADYQAIITLPYFHLGSENVSLVTESEIVADVFSASVKTGLPTTSVILSRVSLSQTYRNIQIVKGPYRKLEIVDDFKSKKPFLVLVRENELNEEEQHLLTKCKKIKESVKYNIYKLEVETLNHISDNLYADTEKKLMQTRTFNMDEFQSTDSLKTFVYNGYEDLLNINSLRGKGCYQGKIKNYNDLYIGGIPNWKNETYTLSFWMDNFTTDLYPRSTVELIFSDSVGVVYGTDYFTPGKSFCLLDGSWALVERNFKLKSKSDQIRVAFWSWDFQNDKQEIRVDELLIKPKTTTLYKNIVGESITINNRKYPAIEID